MALVLTNSRRTVLIFSSSAWDLGATARMNTGLGKGMGGRGSASGLALRVAPSSIPSSFPRATISPASARPTFSIFVPKKP